MVEHDGLVGTLLKKLDDLGIADNTIVIYTTDNGAELFSWPDGGTTPFRSEKNSNWEGGYRVPAVVRWPGVDQAAYGDQRHFRLRGLGADLHGGGRANRTSRRSSCTATMRAARPSRCISTALTSTISSAAGPTTRRAFFYWTDDGDLAGLRYDQWKVVFLEQQHEGLKVWQQPLVALRAPLLFNLRTDPFEKANIESGEYERWYVERMFVMAPAQAIVGKELADLQGLPAASEAGQFLGRRRDGEADQRSAGRQLNRDAPRVAVAGSARNRKPGRGGLADATAARRRRENIYFNLYKCRRTSAKSPGKARGTP